MHGQRKGDRGVQVRARDAGGRMRVWLGQQARALQMTLVKLARSAPGARVFCRLLMTNPGAEWPTSRKFGCDVEMARDLLIASLLKIRDKNGNTVPLIANRVQPNTETHAKLQHFLACLDVPTVATFRDSPVYMEAAELGKGIVDMIDSRAG